MSFSDLVNHAIDKKRFHSVEHYIDFCARYLEYIDTGLQARIVSQNESHYQFLQYRKEGSFNITRPINSRLMYDAVGFAKAAQQFNMTLEQLRDGHCPSDDLRENLIRTIYTLQQSIGATLDGLPAGKSNQARKVNGDLFERLIRLLIVSLNVDCVSGTMQVPIKDVNGIELFKSSYQHDLMLSKDNELKIIGSVKTSSKDRIDKVFMDKFLYNRLTDTALPHIAIFLNDVQRKKAKRENEYGVSATFLPGHFKAYTIKLNPLDGVYYCDIRPNMVSDALLSQHIKTIDHFFYSDLWELLDLQGQTLPKVAIRKEDNVGL
ncbi:MAG: hypothetical protein KAI61_03565 [Alphaproteobacteria bacterium]|nr:hypothetical protein [Alphaproteobacteria bacterium]MCK5518469.1 hypothetical protein [Alphaproteobacteria bacterium]MCK5554921.1 hypothetical protein [Alphaproteobacteria bacterium]MCK5659473.1 hypothetical protein [Alphaproteobacteria bacterium]